MSYLMHGDTGTRLYRIWKSMKCRCLNSAHPTYQGYGARGISICDEWVESYPAFKRWALENGYDDHLELDRIDVNGDYEPSNCRWITHREQTLNRRDTLFVIDGGERKLAGDFLDANHVPRSTFAQWRGMGIENEKLSQRIGREVVICGGKKNHQH